MNIQTQKQNWLKQHKQDPIIKSLSKYQQVIWFNPNIQNAQQGLKKVGLIIQNIYQAQKRLQRFAPYIKKVFPETQKNNGIIESQIYKLTKTQQYLQKVFKRKIKGKIYIKLDNYLPISGSVKARGGIYQVLKYAQQLTQKQGLINKNQSHKTNYQVFASQQFKQLFNKYQISVGSTGNLGLSIGIMGSKLGFNVTVHMSSDAKEWKKQKLRSLNVKVIQYKQDYSKAVQNGRKQAKNNKNTFFIDDQNSVDLYLGYSVAGQRLKQQLQKQNIKISQNRQLFVYLPCGVGGGPGGITFGLKNIFKDNVHCIFVQPTHSPCFLLGVYSKLHDKICVNDIGLDNATAADGLAVGRASGFVGKSTQMLIDGYYTVNDENMFDYLKIINKIQNIKIQPSACVGLLGPIKIQQNIQYLKNQRITKQILQNSIHLIWATGGNMVPQEQMNKYITVSKLVIQ